MKLVKSLLLGSAAGLAAVAGASAADLPSRKAAPAEYVRVCSAYGAGFFYIPGTDVCLKVGGAARWEAQYQDPVHDNGSPWGMRALGRIELDARNPTAYGTLRAFVRLDTFYRTGILRSGTQERWGQAIPSTAANDSGWAGGRVQTNIILDKAFVQWGGLVAGRTASFFDFYNSPELIGLMPASNIGSTQLIGYIATFGSGFYASLSLEDTIQRRQGIIEWTPATGLANFQSGAGPAYYSGFWAPDIVANLGVEQSWGKAQISGALHQIKTSTFGAGVPAGFNGKSEWGWAVSGGVQINLPMLAPGDYLWLNASYAQGAWAYVNSGWFGGALTGQGVKNSMTYYSADAFVDPATGGLTKSKTWGLVAALQHYWAPTLRSGFFGGYGRTENPGNVADFDIYAVGGNLVWSPVRALDIGFEIAYQGIKGRGIVVNAATGVPCAGANCGGYSVSSAARPGAATGAGGGVAGTAGLPAVVPGGLAKASDGNWIARFRVQRSF